MLGHRLLVHGPREGITGNPVRAFQGPSPGLPPQLSAETDAHGH